MLILTLKRALIAAALALGPTCAQFAYGQETYAAGACSEVPGSQSCIDTTPCKTLSSGQQVCLSSASLPAGAIQVPYGCWQYAYQYACQGTTTNTCAQYQNNSACGVASSTCNDTIAETGQCDEWTYTYQCQTQAQQTGQQMSCTNGLFETSQFPTPPNNNNSFTTAALGLEITGEAQTYADASSIFAGVAETCRKGYSGIQNCCKSTPGGETNSAAMSLAIGAAASVVKYAGEKAVDLASPYVFDAMYSNGIFSQALTNNFTLAFNINAADGGGNLGTSLATNGLSVGAYGFTLGTGAMPAGLFGGNISLLGGSDGYLAFNPYVFAVVVAIQVLQALASCSQGEQMLALHKGSGLSTFINETCSKSVLGECLQYTDNYCSFNSQLAEIINIQGKTQLGLPLAGCGGLTPTQISQIDFTKIDFSSFTSQMLQQALQNVPSSTGINTNYTPIMQGTGRGSSQAGTSSVLPTYPTNAQ